MLIISSLNHCATRAGVLFFYFFLPAGDKEIIARLSEKMQRLLDSYLDGDVERKLYQDKRAEILSKKMLLEEQIE